MYRSSPPQDFDDYEEYFQKENQRFRRAIDDLKEAKVQLIRVQRELHENEKDNKVLRMAIDESRDELQCAEDNEAQQRTMQARSAEYIHRTYRGKLAAQRQEYDMLSRELENAKMYRTIPRTRELGATDLRKHDTYHSLSDVIEYKNGEMSRLYQLCVILKEQNETLREFNTSGITDVGMDELVHKKNLECTQLQTMHAELRRKLHELQCAHSSRSQASVSYAPIHSSGSAGRQSANMFDDREDAKLLTYYTAPPTIELPPTPLAESRVAVVGDVGDVAREWTVHPPLRQSSPSPQRIIDLTSSIGQSITEEERYKPLQVPARPKPTHSENANRRSTQDNITAKGGRSTTVAPAQNRKYTGGAPQPYYLSRSQSSRGIKSKDSALNGSTNVNDRPSVSLKQRTPAATR